MGGAGLKGSTSRSGLSSWAVVWLVEGPIKALGFSFECSRFSRIGGGVDRKCARSPPWRSSPWSSVVAASYPRGPDVRATGLPASVDVRSLRPNLQPDSLDLPSPNTSALSPSRGVFSSISTDIFFPVDPCVSWDVLAGVFRDSGGFRVEDMASDGMSSLYDLLLNGFDPRGAPATTTRGKGGLFFSVASCARCFLWFSGVAGWFGRVDFRVGVAKDETRS